SPARRARTFSASGNRGKNREDIPCCERAVEPIEIADVVRVHEEIDVAPYGPGLIADTSIERRKLRVDPLQRRTNVRRSDRELGRAAAAVAQKPGNEDRDRWRLHGRAAGEHAATVAFAAGRVNERAA